MALFNRKKKDSSAVQNEQIPNDLNVPASQDKQAPDQKLNLESDETIEFQIFKKITGADKKKARLKKKDLEEEQRKASLERYHPDIAYGLSTDMVNQRIKDRMTNKSPKTYTDTLWNILARNFLTYFNFLILVLFGVLIAFGERNVFNCFFVAIAFLNLVISTFQELKAKKITDKMSVIVSPKCQVIRDSKKQEITNEEIVLDDIILLKPGSQIPADAIVKSGEGEANESLQTGESRPIKKKAGDKLLAGSFIVSGFVTAQVDSVGEDTFAGRLQKEAKRYHKSTSELNHYINAFIQVISFLVLPLGGLTAFINYKAFGDVSETITHTVASMVGMIPFGLVLLTSVTLTVGVIRLSKKQALVQDLYSIERLARVNCLCFDKTGTLTDGTLKVEKTVKLDERIEAEAVMGSFLGAFNEANSTAKALQAVYMPSSALTPLKVLPFSSDRKMSAVSFTDGSTYVLGAPEFVCDMRDREVQRLVSENEKAGFRVVMLSQCKGSIVEDHLEGKMIPKMLFVISDHIRDSAFQTIKWFNDNDVEVKVISGDSPETVSEIARRCGVKGSDKCISLEGVTSEDIPALAEKYMIFGRVKPEQKAALVKALKAAGKSVAMTGDGVNDILAMKKADCAIAMANGSDACRSAAHVVLMNSDFASMPDIVKEGRRAVNNVQLSATLFLMKTFFTILLTMTTDVLGLFMQGFHYPFVTKNLFVLELITIGIDGFLLALQPNDNIIRGNFAKKVIKGAMPGAISMFASVLIVLFIRKWAGIATDRDSFTTMEVFLINFVGLIVLFSLCWPFNLYRFMVFILSAAGVFLILCFGGLKVNGADYKTLNEKQYFVLLYIALALLISNFIVQLIFKKQEKAEAASSLKGPSPE